MLSMVREALAAEKPDARAAAAFAELKTAAATAIKRRNRSPSRAAREEGGGGG